MRGRQVDIDSDTSTVHFRCPAPTRPAAAADPPCLRHGSPAHAGRTPAPPCPRACGCAQLSLDSDGHAPHGGSARRALPCRTPACVLREERRPRADDNPATKSRLSVMRTASASATRRAARAGAPTARWGRRSWRRGRGGGTTSRWRCSRGTGTCTWGSRAPASARKAGSLAVTPARGASSGAAASCTGGRGVGDEGGGGDWGGQQVRRLALVTLRSLAACEEAREWGVPWRGSAALPQPPWHAHGLACLNGQLGNPRRG